MTDSYSLTVLNQSEGPESSFAVLATLPAQGPGPCLSTAWQAAPVWPDTQHRFDWQMDWGFAWGLGPVEPGADWDAGGTLAADPSSPQGCAAELSYDGDFRLLAMSGTPDGDLSIHEDASIPVGQPASVGVTLAGSPVVVAPAGPNLAQRFTLQPTYYVAAGDFAPGQLVDGAAADMCEVTFPAGTTSLTATYEPDGTWVISRDP